jgi:hypothetical protein
MRNKYTHVVIGVPADNSILRQAQLLGELRAGMETVALCTNRHDAEIVRSEWQQKTEERVYSVVELL